MAKQKIKKGDVCYVYSTDSRYCTNRETKVASAGPKRVTAEGYPHDKFYADNLRAEVGSYVLFPGTKEQYEAYLIEQQDKKRILLRIHKVLSDLTNPDLNEVYEFIQSKLK